MKEILLRSPSTSANVGPGYDIFAMALKDPYDDVRLTLNDSGIIKIEIIGEAQNIPCTIADNTAGLALQELIQRKNLSCGVDVQIIKKMPSGGGLGTTGASAAAAIYGMNKLLELNLSNNELIDIARMGEVASGGSPHADNVAASIMGGFVLIKSYHPIDVLKLELPEFPTVVSVIRKSQRTTRGFITYEIGQEKLKEQMARCSRVIHAIYTKDIQEFGSAISVDYIAEPVRGAAIPEYIETKRRVIEAGAFGCTISGGGSSVIALCSLGKQPEIASIMHNSFSKNPNYVTTIQSSTSNVGVHVIE
jgi:homoserine kinase